MAKNYKKVYGYGIIMVVCVMVIVLIAALSENRLESYQSEYEQAMTTGQKQIEALEEELDELTKKNQELEKAVAQSKKHDSDLVTVSQAYSDLKDIFDLYKSGKTDEAKTKINKFEPMGVDDTTLEYYEVLKELLNK